LKQFFSPVLKANSVNNNLLFSLFTVCCCYLFTAVSSDDALVDYEETVQLTIFTPFVLFLTVLISLLSLMSLVAFFTDTGNINRLAYRYQSINQSVSIFFKVAYTVHCK